MKVRWIVVMKKDADSPTEAVPFEEYHDAWNFYDVNRLSWTDVYLCEVIRPIR